MGLATTFLQVSMYRSRAKTESDVLPSFTCEKSFGKMLEVEKTVRYHILPEKKCGRRTYFALGQLVFPLNWGAAYYIYIYMWYAPPPWCLGVA